MKLVIILAIALSLISCASTYNPEKLPISDRDECVYLEEKVVLRERRGIGFLWEDGIAAGTYKALYEDKKGVFYTREGRPVWQTMVAGPGDEPSNEELKHEFKMGGIWIPKDKTSGPRLYSIFEANPGALEQSAQVSNDIAMNQPVSVGNPAAGAVGGAIGAAIGNALMQADDGKIFLWREIKDPAVKDKVSQVQACEENLGSEQNLGSNLKLGEE